MSRQEASLGQNGEAGISHPPVQKLHDDSVTFEEYVSESSSDSQQFSPHCSQLHYASITRADTQRGGPQIVAQREMSTGQRDGPLEKENEPRTVGATTTSRTLSIANEEYIQASRAVRTASWGAVFYLITTDVLGPYSTG